jgi:hypothetical protein
VPLWTPWGKGFKGVALRSALGPPSVQRPALGSYTTSWDANSPTGPPVYRVGDPITVSPLIMTRCALLGSSARGGTDQRFAQAYRHCGGERSRSEAWIDQLERDAVRYFAAAGLNE